MLPSGGASRKDEDDRLLFSSGSSRESAAETNMFHVHSFSACLQPVLSWIKLHNLNKISGVTCPHPPIDPFCHQPPERWEIWTECIYGVCSQGSLNFMDFENRDLPARCLELFPFSIETSVKACAEIWVSDIFCFTTKISRDPFLASCTNVTHNQFSGVSSFVLCCKICSKKKERM